MYCNTNQLPTLPCCGTHPKTHGARGLNNHYYLRFYPKLGNVIFEISCIPCTCVRCTSMLNQPCISGITSKKKSRYQPVTNCTYWPVLGPYKNWYIIHLSPKSTPFGEFEEIHQAVRDRISDNMASLVQYGKYDSINTSVTRTSGYYVIKFISEAYTLQNNTKIDGKMISAGELVIKAQYLCSSQEKTNWYWEKQ